MKNILIPYDFSNTAINALNYTKKMFDGLEVNIFLLDVYISNPSEMMSDEKNDIYFNEIDNEIEDELKYLVDVLQKEKNNFSYEYVVKSNTLTKAVVNTIQEKNIDLVVTGTKGTKSLAETFIGTNTMKIINANNLCPVLVVPTDYKFLNFNQIVFSTNYKRAFNTKELGYLNWLTTFKKCKLEVVNLAEESFLSTKQQTNKENLKVILSNLNVEYKKLEWAASETNTIEKHIEITKSQLLVLINHKYTFFNQFLEENVVKKAAFHSKIPLLILPEIS
ncbi:hypothetical protein LPB136_04055 [Tenacibaculum todarodis]|uniref:UspA domain-containing protein n=1 Tax=Tenacibaculum todarodis TaxID=1850252 RepID=A0A1L3JHH3_9FLAO|nr:universal stress protein [Tenacibaculum todarodis]APG64590.1 hypothetical protein LPB136_04055 [Tenacibaculum todarodis]